MTYQSRGPSVLSGAFVTIPSDGGKPQTIPFQYNPATLQRSLQPQQAGEEPQARAEAVRFTGPPIQTINIDIELNAADGMCTGDPAALQAGSLPQLAELELLVYPDLNKVSEARSKLASGVMEIAPQTAPRTLFVWGKSRVLPVVLTSYQITEELFDNRLNPIQVTAQVAMRVLTYADLQSSNRGYFDFVTYQRNLIQLSQLASGAQANANIGVNPSKY